MELQLRTTLKHFTLLFYFILNAVHKIQMLNVTYVFAVVTYGYLLGSHLQAFFVSVFSMSFT